jgi:hypothetical protein
MVISKILVTCHSKQFPKKYTVGDLLQTMAHKMTIMTNDE